MLANKTPDPEKPGDDIPMEKAANGYEYDSYQYTEANSNNQKNKPLSMESRSVEGQDGGNDVDVYNKNTDNSNTDSQSDGLGNVSSSQFENTADIGNIDIANSDDIGYKGGEEKENSEINKNLDEGLQHYNKILSYEPKITEFITDMATKLSMNIEGLEYRIKSKDSYLRKLEGIENEEEIRDIIRYTYSGEPNILSNKIIQSIEEFNTKGYNTIKIKNT